MPMVLCCENLNSMMFDTLLCKLMDFMFVEINTSDNEKPIDGYNT